MRVWLHKSLKESQLFEKDSNEYKEALQNGWNVNRKDTILSSSTKPAQPVKRRRRNK